MSAQITPPLPRNLDVPGAAERFVADVGWNTHDPDAQRLATDRREAADRLASLLAEAARLDIDDVPGWAHLRSTAHATVAVLIASGLVPEALRVRHHDVPVVIARTLAAAWQRVAFG